MSKEVIELSKTDLSRVRRIAGDPHEKAKKITRAKILLDLNDGSFSAAGIASRNNVSETTVYTIIKEYLHGGINEVLRDRVVPESKTDECNFTMGIFFAFLSKCTRPDVTDVILFNALSDVTCGVKEELIGIVTKELTNDEKTKKKVSVNNFKQCKTNGDSFAPFLQNDNHLIFQKSVKDGKTRDSCMERMCALKSRCLSDQKSQRLALVQSILTSIGNDSSISSEEPFYVDSSKKWITKAELLSRHDFCLEAFLLGVWDYCLRRGNNADGRKSHEIVIKTWEDSLESVEKRSFPDATAAAGAIAAVGVAPLIQSRSLLFMNNNYFFKSSPIKNKYVDGKSAGELSQAEQFGGITITEFNPPKEDTWNLFRVNEFSDDLNRLRINAVSDSDISRLSAKYGFVFENNKSHLGKQIGINEKAVDFFNTLITLVALKKNAITKSDPAFMYWQKMITEKKDHLIYLISQIHALRKQMNDKVEK